MSNNESSSIGILSHEYSQIKDIRQTKATRRREKMATNEIETKIERDMERESGSSMEIVISQGTLLRC